MLMLYFSGTGNSKFIAEMFCRDMNAEYHSIEDNIDFSGLIEGDDTIGFCYPVYGSRAPRIMREFAAKYTALLKDKKIIIFCTQMLFSGDGARSFTYLFPQGHFNVIYAEHFLMPNNVCNLFFVPLASQKQVDRYMHRAVKKMQRVCIDIRAGKKKLRGFNVFSRFLGLPQGVFVPWMEKRALGTVRINKNCNKCGLCLSVCPMKNLENCTICYRCVNICPNKAITTFIHSKVKRQYKGLKSSSDKPYVIAVFK